VIPDLFARFKWRLLAAVKKKFEAVVDPINYTGGTRESKFERFSKKKKQNTASDTVVPIDKSLLATRKINLRSIILQTNV